MDEQIDSKSNDYPQIQGRWTSQQHTRFLSALMAHGKNWKLIQNTVQTRTTSQVRSHSQKFFLKLLKVEKQRKKNMKKGISQVSKGEEDLIKLLINQPITCNTPQQILHFLKKQGKQTPKQKPELKIQSELGQHKMSRAHLIFEQAIAANQQQSFLFSLIKRNKGVLQREEGFTQLIDFPLATEEVKEEQTSNKRKISFSLYQQEEDDIKYSEHIKKLNGK